MEMMRNACIRIEKAELMMNRNKDRQLSEEAERNVTGGTGNTVSPKTDTGKRIPGHNEDIWTQVGFMPEEKKKQ